MDETTETTVTTETTGHHQNDFDCSQNLRKAGETKSAQQDGKGTSSHELGRNAQEMSS